MYTDPQTGCTLRPVSSLYTDFGLEIIGPDGEELFYNPCCLSSESYGITWTDEDGEELDKGIPWTDQEWRECLASECDDFLCAYIEEPILRACGRIHHANVGYQLEGAGYSFFALPDLLDGGCIGYVDSPGGWVAAYRLI